MKKNIDLQAKLGFDRFSGLYLFVVFIVMFAIWAPHTFLTASTLHSVASSQAVAGIIALAVLIPITAGQYDLSVGANANIAGIAAILLQSEKHWSAPATVVVCVLIGLAIGLVNAVIVVGLRVNSFIATLAMGSILSATQVIITNNAQPQPVLAAGWNNLTQKSVGGFQIVVLYLIVLAAIIWWLLDFTPAGRYLHAIGHNSEATRLAGVRVERWTFGSLVLGGLVAGIAGVLYTSQTGPALQFGPTLLLPAFAAVFLGSTQLYAGRFNVWGTLIAIYVLATGVEGFQLVSGQQWVSDMFNGVALIAAVALAVSRERRHTRRANAAGDTTPEPTGPDTDLENHFDKREELVE